MSVLLEFAMFPTDKGESVSTEVSELIKVIRDSNLSYQLTSMGTIVETETFEEATAVLNKCYTVLNSNCNRVYCTATFDIRKGKSNRILQKIKSVEEKIN